jgi:pimeloyl-ACP methyl ester carboxylesterase
MRQRLRLILVAAAVGIGLFGLVQDRRARPIAAPAAVSRLALTSCQLAHPYLATRIPANCGTFEVPEDHDQPAGRKLSLRVAVIPAEAGGRDPDPVFFLAGGPGQAATEIYPAVADSLARVARKRDIVLVDQRGTGSSARLDCSDLSKPDSVDRSDAAELALVAACGEKLSKTADLRRYGSEDFVRDLDLVRDALGAQRVNLVGSSYGTRAALVYARRFPDRVRTLVLDGVAPLEMAVGGSFERDAQRAFTLAVGRCTADADCHQAFPDPAGDLAALITSLEKGPRTLSLRDPLTGAPRQVTLDAGTVRRLVLLLSYAPETVSLLPALLAEAKRGDAGPLGALGLSAGRDVQATISRPLQFAVLCAEDEPWFPPDDPAADRTRYLGRSVRESLSAACRRFPHGTLPASFREPVRSSAPTLLLSGEADPVTPPEWAAIAARNLPSSRQLVLAGQGHGTLGRGCMPKVVERFIEAGKADGLDASCLDAVKPQPFFLDLAGPMP